jgi:hypothetical protein
MKGLGRPSFVEFAIVPALLVDLVSGTFGPYWQSLSSVGSTEVVVMVANAVLAGSSISSPPPP